MSDSLAARIAGYENTAAANEAVYEDFTRLTDTIPFLKKHRDLVEENSWGFGDRAFHYMWMLILSDAALRDSPVRALEIGVYKGQVISLWALIARELRLDIAITGISPFEGNVKPMSRIRRKLRAFMDADYRAAIRAGNLYPQGDYLGMVREVFGAFELDVAPCRMIKGLSTDPAVRAQAHGEYSLIYIDGDHSFDAVRADIKAYAPMVKEGGYLVMDDASLFLPGNLSYKGREGVSRACEEIPALGFANVLNVGHDRVYRKGPPPAA